MQTDRSSQDILCRDPGPSEAVELGEQEGHYPGSSVGTATALVDVSLAEIVRLAATGDPLAWQELVRRYDGMIGSIGRRYGLSSADVDELRQITWLKLVEHLGRIEQPERVGGWLLTTAKRESCHLFSRSTRYRTGTHVMLGNLPDVNAPEVDARSLTEETHASLRAAWSHLKPRCQELLSHLVADDPAGYRELSQLLDIPVGSIGPTRGRCVEFLRRLVVEEGLTAR